jgi:predicted PurR-regulated permease PerM
MTSEKPRLYFFLVLLSLSLILSFLVFRPFLYSLILAMVFAIIFQPLYQRVLKWVKGQAWLAAFLTIIILIIFILVPLAFLFFQIFQEAQTLYLTLISSFDRQAFISGLPPIFSNLSVDIDQYVKNILSFLVQNLGTIFSNLAKIFVSLFVFLMALFFLLKDGGKLKQKIIILSPLTKDEDEAIIKKIVLAVNSVIKGNLFVAILQGISTSVGLTIFGVPNPVVWGTLAAVGALVPGVGTTIVLLPAIGYLYFTGQVIGAAGLLVWGILAVGMIDNFLGPKLVGKGTGLHPLLVLLSVLGGLILFGPIGFILGPLVISLLVVLLDIYADIFK